VKDSNGNSSPSGQSSSSLAQSSSSSVPSSSSLAPSSSSLAQSSSSSVPSSSSLAPSSSSFVGYAGSYGSLDYEGQTYRTVEIGTQTWMADNLNYDVEGSRCYDDDPANCEQYGRLYNWPTAMYLPASCGRNFCASVIQSPHQGICPEGWHIPSEAEWSTLSSYVQSTSDCTNCAAKLLKATRGWSYNGNGTDQYGFSALPGGHRTFFDNSPGSFEEVGDYGYWWIAKEYELQAYAYRWTIGYGPGVSGWYRDYKLWLFSVRCIKD